MIEKFLKNIEKFAQLNSEKKTKYYVDQHNIRVLSAKKKIEKTAPTNTLQINKPLIQFQDKKNTTPKSNKGYEDDGSYFCIYAVNGNKIVCLKNKEKFEFELDNIYHPDPQHFLAKKSNHRLNELVKKQKVYLQHSKNNKVIVFLDKYKTENINQVIIDNGLANSIEKKQNDHKDKPVTKKINFAYGIFVKNHTQFDALFNNDKITIKLFGVNTDNISEQDQHQCKSIIYDFVSKKSIILEFKEEKDNYHECIVKNKEGKNLNDLIISQQFNSVYLDKNDESILSNNDKTIDVEEIQHQEISTIPAMFKNTISKSNSPFAKKSKLAPESIMNDNLQINIQLDHQLNHIETNNIQKEEIQHQESSVIPTMFKNTISNPNSPFAKKSKIVPKIITDNNSQINNNLDHQLNHIETNNIQKEEIQHQESSVIPLMFKNTTLKPNSPFTKKTKNISKSIENEVNEQIKEKEELIDPIKKKVSFMKR